MSASSKFANLCGTHKSPLPDPIRCDEEMPAPAPHFEQVRSICMRTGTAVIEREQRRPSMREGKFVNRDRPGNHWLDGGQMPFEFGQLELVNGGIPTRESTGFEIPGWNNVMI